MIEYVTRAQIIPKGGSKKLKRRILPENRTKRVTIIADTTMPTKTSFFKSKKEYGSKIKNDLKLHLIQTRENSWVQWDQAAIMVLFWAHFCRKVKFFVMF